MKLTSIPLAAILITLLFGGITLTSVMGWWQTESSKVPATYSGGEASGQYNPADIRGSYTFGEISELFGVPLPDLQAAFRLPQDADPASYPVKSLEEEFAGLPVEMGTGSVRMFVAFYLGLPYPLDGEDSYLFSEAAEILKAKGKMRPEQATYLDGHVAGQEKAADPVEPSPAPTQAAAVEATPAPTVHAPADGSVTGKTTFQDLLDWGVSQQAIEAILGEEMPAPGTVIREYYSQKGLEFSSGRSALQAEIDRLK